MKLKDIILDLFGPAPEPDRPSAVPAAAPPQRAAVPPPSPAPAAGRTPHQVLSILRRHGAPYERVLFTQNRRTMVSVGKDRRLIRLNSAFAAADEAMLKHVAVLYTPGTRGRRKAQAKAEVQRFINAIPVPDGDRPRRRRRHVHPLDRPLVARLQAEFDRANRAHFNGRLPRVPIHLSHAMVRRNGHFSSQPLEIVISRRLCVHGMPGEAEETMRHEMIHLWQYVEGVEVDHGPAFRRMAHRLDVHPRATRPVRWKQRG